MRIPSRMEKIFRCEWANRGPREMAYHDREWGVPVHDDRLLFEFLILEGAQAGLSWSIVLKKREALRKAFDEFEPAKVACYGKEKIQKLLENPELIRNPAKIVSAVRNARSFLQVQKEFGSFDCYVWRFVDGKTIHNKWRRMDEVPARTPLSDKLSKDLQRRGFSFVGSTICYAFMQAVGMVNDHVIQCFRHRELVGGG